MESTQLSHDAAASVVKLLGPWDRASCACINRTWKGAVDEVSFPHWLVEAGTAGKLWMCNLVSGRDKVVELDLPWDSIPEKVASFESRVLCSFQGLVLIELHKHSLILGDPLLNKWIKLPDLHLGHPPSNAFMTVGGFCPKTSTLLLSNGGWTATLDLESVQWTVDPLPDLPDQYTPLSQVCYLNGIFYGSFVTRYCERVIACYDPVSARRWWIVKVTYNQIFLAQESQDKMLVCTCGQRNFNLLEASRSGSSNKLDIVFYSPLMEDGHIGKRILRTEEAFYGKDGMLFWEAIKGETITVASLRDGGVREMKCPPYNSVLTPTPPRKYHYLAAPGTLELLNALEMKISRIQN